MNWVLFFGALLGLLAFMLSAYAEHGMHNASLHELTTLLMALKYQQLHAVLISLLGCLLYLELSQALRHWLKSIAGVFILGILLFSFSLWNAVLFNLPVLKKLAPIGGSLLMLGWFLLIILSLMRVNQTK